MVRLWFLDGMCFVHKIGKDNDVISMQSLLFL